MSNIKIQTDKTNKAEEKRIKQATESLTAQLSRELMSFRERFLKSYVEYMIGRFDVEIKRIQETQYGGLRFGYTLEMFNSDKAYKIAQIEAKKALSYTNTLEFIIEANGNYWSKFNKMVNVLVSHGVRSYPLDIETIGNATSDDFSFLITHKDITVHARVIFACGEINAPHYRFIITKRKSEQ